MNMSSTTVKLCSPKGVLMFASTVGVRGLFCKRPKSSAFVMLAANELVKIYSPDGGIGVVSISNPVQV